jgi:hypothetical protein
MDQGTAFPIGDIDQPSHPAWVGSRFQVLGGQRCAHMAHIRARPRRRSRLAYWRQLDRTRRRDEPRGDTDVLPFGKHRGKLIRDVPDGYLRWMVTNQTQFWEAAARELRRRARAARKGDS